MIAKGYSDSDEAFSLVTAIRDSGRNPADALILLVMAIVTVYKHSHNSLDGVTDEEFAESIGRSVLEGIHVDAANSVEGMSRQ